LGIGFWIFTMPLSNAAEPSKNFTLVVHGGSGTITRSPITTEIESQYRASLDHALKAGQKILASGGTSVEAVVTTMCVFEDDPLFNAGKGAVFTRLTENEGPLQPWEVDDKYGTVGAVALDQHGNLVAGTSTGGLTNKLYGRVGDSPIIGAGTYADKQTVAVSCTGTGEFFMRGLVA
jgi:isoaspartyl peptidase/L-asparaginase-like protein (Ntn-hydrolase superfamily)